MRKLIRKIEQVAYYRNGISGHPFHVVTFRQFEEPALTPDEQPKMVAIVFEGSGQVAVFNRELLGRGVIDFGLVEDGGNSWRGDQFENELRAAIRADDDRPVTYPVTGADGRTVHVTIPENEEGS
ncbi:hypothetical protein LCGC14_2654330 [marine sediment metagenome]|uniref:Uncharacterized protein n=1 Tax=marine sediment metagenome TaxID=412755 RepID=A0A0F8ZTS1_9ZZZZ